MIWSQRGNLFQSWLVLGSKKEYIGVVMDLPDVTKLSDKDVEKYYKIYQVKSGKKIADSLAYSSFQLMAKAVDHGLRNYGSIDDKEALVKDCKKNELIMKEISNLKSIWFTYTQKWKTLSITFGICSFCKSLQVERGWIPKTT